MIKFRQKAYADVRGYGKQAIGWVKKNPGVPLSVASLGLLVRNTRVNDKARHEESGYKEKQLKALSNLTNRLDKMTGSLEATRGSLDSMNSAMASHMEAMKNLTPNTDSPKKRINYRRGSETKTTPRPSLWSRLTGRISSTK